MNYSQKRTLVGRIVYIGLTLMAVTILCVTMYTFFGGSRRANQTPETVAGVPTPETARTRPPVTTERQEPTKPGGSFETEERPVNAEPVDQPDLTDPAETASAAPNNTPRDWSKLKVSMPVEGAVVKKHNLQAAVYSLTMNDYRVHQGVDIECEIGDDVLSCAYGKIKSIGRDPFMGCTVIIDHGDGLVSYYRNLSDDLGEAVEVGATVYAGQAIGQVGESAIVEIAEEPHLHFELELNGKPVDPLSMLNYVEATAAPKVEDAK